MKLIPFLKLLNQKIKKYDSYATNPFGNRPLSSITLIWLEDTSEEKDFFSSRNNEQ